VILYRIPSQICKLRVQVSRFALLVAEELALKLNPRRHLALAQGYRPKCFHQFVSWNFPWIFLRPQEMGLNLNRKKGQDPAPCSFHLNLYPFFSSQISEMLLPSRLQVSLDHTLKMDLWWILDFRHGYCS
jgi:hypothetical protein